MKAYLNNDVVIAIGEKDELFPNCIPIEITEEEKTFIESCKTPKRINGVFIEGFTDADLQTEKINKAISIDLEYTHKIDDLMVKHHNKVIQAIYFSTTYTIPQQALNEMQALKDECNAKILALGITDFTYRQNVPQLAKVETIKK